MPQTLTYPGVYIEELSSGVHTITGVATSIAAFIGWAPKGPIDAATLVQSWPDFERRFGGMDSRSYLGYAVRQFFDNGGQQTYIIRLAWDGTVTAAAGTPTLAVAAANTVGGLSIEAKNPGAWGSDLFVSVTVSAADPTRFGIDVLDSSNNILESFFNLSPTSSDSRFVETVIGNDSTYINIVPPVSGMPTTATPTQLIGGADGSVLVPNDGLLVADGNFENVLFNVSGTAERGVVLLDRIDIFNLLCVPGETDAPSISKLQQYCAEHRAFYIVDSPGNATFSSLTSGPIGTGAGSLTGAFAMNSAFYFPWISAPDPLAGNRPKAYPPCGFMAGIYASTDANRGVWKAPAGIQTGITGASGLQAVLTDKENGTLNPQAINCLRQFRAYGNVVWGARTLAGNDQTGSDWKYVPIRRLALFIESSLYRGTQWAVFEPNDETLWSQLRLNVGAFMQGLFLDGAFQGTSPKQAYFVKCDSENNPQANINLGIVTVLVGFAPLYPAEFVVIQIQQIQNLTQP